MILSLDTSDYITHVCLRAEDGEYHTRSSRIEGNAEQLLALIHSLYSETGRDFADTKTIVVCIGPGSFTGVRTGIATVQGLSSPRSIGVFACSSLLAAALYQSASSKSETQERYHIVRRANKKEFFQGKYVISRVGDGEPAELKQSSGVGVIEVDHLRDLAEISGETVLELPCHRYAAEFKTLPHNPASLLDEALMSLQNIDGGSECQYSPGANGVAGLYAKSISAKTLKERGLR